MSVIEVYDTTLRDGTQAEDIAFTLEDKMRIAYYLDELGFHYIEGGYPGSNPKDALFFEEVKRKPLKNAKAAGAIGTILLHTSRNTVIFYTDPTLTSLETLDQFDELHINHKKTARRLIAIFTE